MHHAFISLAQNAALLLAATLIFDLVAAHPSLGKRHLREIPTGLALGLIGLLVMLTPWEFSPGVVFDTRSVLLGLTGLFFGSLPTLIVMAITSAFRLYQGGTGALTGVLLILTTGATGLVWRRFRRTPLSSIGWRELLLFGLVVHLVMLAVMATLPRDAVIPVLSKITLPVLAITPLGTALLGALMANRLRRETQEEALREAELQFRTLANTGPGMIWASGPDQQCTFFNQTWLDFTGHTLAQERGDGWLAGVHPEDRKDCLATYRAAFDHREPFSMTYRLRRHDGVYRWLQDDGTPLYNTQGGFLGFIGYCLDVTERQQGEQVLRNREAFLAAVLATTQDGFLVLDRQRKVVEANEAYARMSGYGVEELRGLETSALVAAPPEERARRIEQIREAGSHRFETRHRRKDGTLFDVEVSVTHLEREESQFVCFVRDITSRKHAEANLLRLMMAVQQVGESIIVTDADGVIQYVNPGFEAITGYPCDEAIGQNPRLLKSGRQDDAFYAHLWGTISRGHTWRGEMINKRKDGTYFIETATISPVHDQTGQIMNYVAVKRDVTKVKEAEQTLRESMARLTAFMEHAPMLISEFDIDGRYLLANRAVGHFYRTSPELLLGKSFSELLPREVDALFRKRIDRVLTERRSIVVEDQLNEKGRDTFFSTTLFPLFDEGENIRSIGAIALDITRRREAEARVAESHQLLAKLARLVPGVIYQYRLDPDGRSAFPYASPGIHDIYEVTPEEVCQDATPVFGRLHPEDHDRVAEAIFESARTLHTFYCEFRVVLPRQGLRWRWSQAQPQRTDNGGTLWHGIILDITDRKRVEEERERLEQQLRQAQKMEAIGTLAGGIAHDFNNILGAISGYTELSLAKIPEDSRIKRYLEQIQASSRRAINLVRQILEFSRLSENELVPLRVTPLVKEMIKLLREVIPSTIEVRINLRTERDTVRGNATQLHQILMNLCTNAYQAMHETGGLLEITLAAETVPKEGLDKAPHGLPPGPYLKLSVRDTGPGIDPLIRERIFDPFFTTKKVGEGTGLGLSVVHGIVNSYEGRISLESRPGAGTTFHVYLPLVDEAAAAVLGETDSTMLNGEGRILLIDDEVVLAGLMQEMLQARGYTVTVKTSSVEALETFRRRPHHFDLVITDLTMPELTGIALAKKMISLRSEIPILLCTGFMDAPLEEEAAKAGIRAVLLKPVNTGRLVSLIHQLLPAGAKPGEANGADTHH